MLYLPNPTFKILPLVQVNYDENGIDLQSIRDLCSEGLSILCPPEDRALAWLNLLSIYPANPQHWISICKTISKSYQNFTKNFSERLLNQINVDITKELNDFSTDSKLINCIKADINRSISQLLFLIHDDGSSCKTTEEENELNMHINRIERILYIFAKVNPKFGYIQGFNELIIPLYYVMHSASNLFFGNLDYVEAVSYEAFAFLLISSDLSDFFNLDLSICEDKLSPFSQLLCRHLPKTYKKLKFLNIKPIQYAYKWFNIMFSQEHSLPQLLPLWDSLLSHLNNLSLFEFAIGVARIQTVHTNIESDYPNFRSKYILKNSIDDLKCSSVFGKILSLLCNIQIEDIHELIKQANIIYDRYVNKKRVTLFSQKSSSLP